MAKGGNQPQNTSSNHNTRRPSRAVPKKAKSLRFQKYKKTGISAAKRVDNKQTAAINSLSKQVYSLQMSKYGKVQQNYHNMVEVIKPSGTQPLCFDMTDFTCERAGLGTAGGVVYQYNSPSVDQITHWHRNNVALSNFYWENQNQDAPDTGSYLAMDATYFFEIRGNRSLTDTRIRIDIVAQKPGAILPDGGLQLPVSDLVLPNTLGYFKHLTRPYLNRINPSFFKKYLTKIVYINSAKTDPNVKGTTGNNMRFSLRIKPNKLCIQNETNPIIIGGVFQDQEDPSALPAVQEEYAQGNFGPLNVPIEQPLWCLISSDDPAGGPSDVEVLVSRRIRWRDSVGSAAI